MLLLSRPAGSATVTKITLSMYVLIHRHNDGKAIEGDGPNKNEEIVVILKICLFGIGNIQVGVGVMT